MNNVMQLMQVVKNPQAFIQQAMGNSQINQNPIARNALEMYQKGDTKGLNELANNLCRERGIEPEQVLKQVQGMFGL